MNQFPLNKVAMLWSGGIDSTAVLANLIKRGYEVTVRTSDLHQDLMPSYWNREQRAREKLWDKLEKLALVYNASISLHALRSKDIWAFALKGTLEIPQRNKRLLDLLMAQVVLPDGLMNVAMGEYVGVDTWLVRDHVPPNDCDHRALSAYLLSEYGMKYRFISLQDFGESRYKSDRLKIGYKVLGDDVSLTTNCMEDTTEDCGECYKCVERAAAFAVANLVDFTQYKKDPRRNERFSLYQKQMLGYDVQSAFGS